MAQGLNSAGTSHRPQLVTAAFLPLILLFAATAVADTRVYRCSSPSGNLEFRQTPYTSGADGQEMRIEDRGTGWKPARAKLKRRPKGPPAADARKRKAEKRNRPSLARQAETCWKRRRLVEEINRKLRRGYKPATGEKLRHKRRVHEDYIRRFCK